MQPYLHPFTHYERRGTYFIDYASPGVQERLYRAVPQP